MDLSKFIAEAKLNRKTTYAGLGTILVAVGSAAISFAKGQPVDVKVLVGAIMAGLGLIAAKDGGVHGTAADSSTPAPAPSPAPATSSSPPSSGFARLHLLILVALAAVAITACATLAGTSGSTGQVDIGKYVCSATAAPTDPTSCTKLVTTVCDGPNGFHNTTATTVPIPKDPAGTCP